MLGVVRGGHGGIVGRGIERHRDRRLRAAPHGKVREHRRAVRIAGGDLHLLPARVRAARDLGRERAGAAGLEIEALGRAAIVGDEHLGILEPGIDHRVEREAAARRERPRDRRGRDPGALECEHHGARSVRQPLHRADPEARGRTVRQDLRETRLELLDDQLRRVDVAPHHEQVRRWLDDPVPVQGELDEAVADHALLGDDLRELRARAEQARVGDRDVGPGARGGIPDGGDHGVAERRLRRALEGLVVALGRLRGRRERHGRGRGPLGPRSSAPARLGPDLLVRAPRAGGEDGEEDQRAHRGNGSTRAIAWALQEAAAPSSETATASPARPRSRPS